MVRFKAIALPTITLAIVVTLLAHRGKSKIIFGIAVKEQLHFCLGKIQSLKCDQTDDNLSTVNFNYIAI